MTPAGEQLLEILRDRLVLDHGLRDEIGSVAGIEWTEEPGAIEADLGYRRVKVERDQVTVTAKRFGARKVIPLS